MFFRSPKSGARYLLPPRSPSQGSQNLVKGGNRFAVGILLTFRDRFSQWRCRDLCADYLRACSWLGRDPRFLYAPRRGRAGEQRWSNGEHSAL